ncbi:AraC family transcriptional regulator [Echinicola marina]|uniref:helix-turn-helix domain-containing protein n=1 Tax=Echinicola marina TaxID=2859768 RepID=UPI001CF713EC|nr:AraC family transcriptional regulator [Echinicola marina]UCS95077.1 AraC family transcriptional regulator [Echinicola marina]
MSEILIKNMVCPRCIMAVEKIFKEQGIQVDKVELGKVSVQESVDKATEELLEEALQEMGFELLREKQVQTVERIKNALHAMMQQEELGTELNLSEYIKTVIPEDYSALSHLFSTTEGITIEKYFIHLKIEKTKELLCYQELQLSEIAWRLGYSSVQHLSSQFKKVVGMTPSAYKRLKDKPRASLDQVK